jgi:hypothetical protein
MVLGRACAAPDKGLESTGQGWHDCGGVLPIPAPLFHLRAAGDHEALMILMPGLVALLCGVIVAVTWLGQRGLIGPLDRPVARTGALRPVAAGLSAGAGLIHLAVIPAHLDDAWQYGAFFVVVAAFQLGWAAAYVRTTAGSLERLARYINGLVIGVWLWSRFVGLPFGIGVGSPEAIGLPDLLATAFEAGLIAMLATPLASAVGREQSAEPLRFADVAIARSFGILAIAMLTGAVLVEVVGSA